MNTISKGQRVYTDVLVIGGGAAGCRAAIEAAAKGVGVTVAVKGRKFNTGSSFYPIIYTLGFQACRPGEQNESMEEHFNDIMEAGEGMCDARLAEILVSEAHESLAPLKRAGRLLYKVDADGGQQKPCFSSSQRAWLVKSLSSFASFFSKEMAASTITVIDNIYIFSLLVEDSECVGAIGLSREGEIVCIHAKAVVLACGGGASIFMHNLNSRELVGDGYVMALEAGAELANLEFIQFIFGICRPVRYVFHQALFAKGCEILNSHGQIFFRKWLPRNLSYQEIAEIRGLHGPFTSRLKSRYFDLSILKEIHNGFGTDSFGVFVHIPEPDRFLQIKNFSRWMEAVGQKGIDLKTQKIEISPHAHAFNGGIKIDENANTGVAGLYSAGEIAAGPHGADRLGGNMMTATQVFGKRAGQNAGLKAKLSKLNIASSHTIYEAVEKIRVPVGKRSAVSIKDIKKRIAYIMWKSAGIGRDEKDLLNAICQLNTYDEHKLEYNRENLWEYISLMNAIQVSRLILNSALMRKESRGSHYRYDFTDKNDTQYGKPIFVRQKDENITHEYSEII